MADDGSIIALHVAVAEFLYTHDYTEKSEKWMRETLAEFRAFAEDRGVKSVGDITTLTVREYAHHIRDDVSPLTHRPRASATVHGRLSATKTFLRWCAGEEWLDPKIAGKLVVPKAEEKVIAILSRRQIALLFDACRDRECPAVGMRDEAILAVFLDTGIRAAELMKLTMDDVWLSPHDSYIRVHRKGRKQQELSLGTRSRRALQRYISHGRPTLLQGTPDRGRRLRGTRPYYSPDPNEQQVFLTRTGRPFWDSDALAEVMDKLEHRAGVEHFQGVRVSPHTCRHTFAINFLEQGGDVYRLMRLLGHTKITHTERYLKAFKEREARRGPSVLDTMGK